MGLTSALFTGLAGLNSSQFRLDTIGDNIANVNTTAFKGSRSVFQTLFSQTISGGSGPGPAFGGTNPVQIGLGSVIGAVQRSFTPGSIETTGVPSDLAIEGNGFFVLRSSDTERVFTRDGTFTLNSEQRLISSDGYLVQGYAIDENFQLITGNVTDIRIPLGTLTTARATSSARLDGTLDAAGAVATQGTILESQVLNDSGGGLATGATLLTDLRDPADLVTPLLANGDVITINGVKYGGRDVPTASFIVGTTGSTVDDFLNWMNEALGINEDAGAAGSPGVAVVGGRLQIRGNAGTENALTIVDGSLLSSNAGTPIPFSFTETQAADGASVHTSFIAYDSLGSPVTIDVVGVLEQRTTGSSTWRFYARSGDDSDVDLDLGSLTVDFDAQGRASAPVNATVLVNRAGSGAADPLVATLDFSRVTSFAVPVSSLVMTSQNGFATGTLIDYTIGDDGTITGTFSNGLTQTIGQIVLATFANPAGLVSRGNNTFFVGANSGEPQIAAPLTLGSGRILGGALELSNVDLSREFINMITASTGFTAASRVISTSDQLLQELLLIARR